MAFCLQLLRPGTLSAVVIGSRFHSESTGKARGEVQGGNCAIAGNGAGTGR